MSIIHAFYPFLKQLLYPLSILWGVATLTFYLLYVFPSAEDQMLGQRSDLQTSEALQKKLGLQEPVFTRYRYFMRDLSPLGIYSYDRLPEKGLVLRVSTQKAVVFKWPFLGVSYQSGLPVSTIIKDALWGTVVLAFSSMCIAFVAGVFLGGVSGIFYNQWPDKLTLFLSTLGISIPSFFSSVLFAWLFGYVWAQQTGLQMTGSLFGIDPQSGDSVIQIQNLILPCLALSIRPVSVITQLMRSSLLNELKQDYTRTARSKGLSDIQVVWNHCFRNALNPVITSAGGWLASLLAGAFFVEYIFNWKGVGKVLIEGVQVFDLPVVSGAILYIAFIFIIIQGATNLLYKVLDPTVKS
jgi:peptide/nickel transport system permease protein